MTPLPPRFFARGAASVARDLLGMRIRSRLQGRVVEGIIIETEAYLGFGDPASHAYRGRLHVSNRNLYGPPGTWYVYRSYGMHWCANLVCRGPEAGSAVLLRGLAPKRGIPIMRLRRKGAAEPVLANGPGKLTQALGIDDGLDGELMMRSPVRVHPPKKKIPIPVDVTPRIGISKAVDWPLRFSIRLP